MLLYRKRPHGLEVLLVHLGGPLFANKDLGSWDIPKGEIEPNEDILNAAKREFQEETGLPLPESVPQSLGSITRPSDRKTIHAWAIEGDCDPAAIKSNSFTMEWPPRSGKQQEFLEVDRGEFFTMEQARKKMHPALLAFLDRLESLTGD